MPSIDKSLFALVLATVTLSPWSLLFLFLPLLDATGKLHFEKTDIATTKIIHIAKNDSEIIINGRKVDYKSKIDDHSMTRSVNKDMDAVKYIYTNRNKSIDLLKWGKMAGTLEGSLLAMWEKWKARV